VIFTAFSVQRDLPKLSFLARFFKGSASAYGLRKVRQCCEKIEHYGSKRNEDGSAAEYDEDLCLSRINSEISILRNTLTEAQMAFEFFYKTKLA
jgi:osomolarity two-component system phosphorelay intermediate protein YPD1